MTTDIHSLNWADYFILGMVGLSALISLVRGFMREAISLATWILAFWIGIKYSVPLSTYLVEYIKTPSLRMMASFGILFISTLIVGGLINYIISQLVDKTGLSGTDRILGMCFGVARGVLLVGVLVMLANYTPFSKDPWLAKSQLIPHFQQLAGWLHKFVPKQVDELSEYLPKTAQAMIKQKES